MKNYILTFLIPVTITLTVNAQYSISTGFEKHPAGTAYDIDMWQSDGFQSAGWQDGMKTRSMVDSSVAESGRQSLRITYPKGGVGPGETGAQISIVLPENDQYYMSYWLRFSNNFSFKLGGKLPGLAAGELCSGGQTCDGTNGFTARFMWRTEGHAVLYLYHMDKPGKWGEDMPLVYPSGEQVTFERGKWYLMTERVKINSAGDKYDGEVEVWVNGKHVLLKKGLRFTSNGEKVDRFDFSTFHGGNTPEWGPAVTCFTWFDNFKVSQDMKDVEMVTLQDYR
jgi:hypothetical protein